MENIKGLLRSKTFWFNMASIGLELTNTLLPLVPPGTTLIIVNIVNIALRTITTQALSQK